MILIYHSFFVFLKVLDLKSLTWSKVDAKTIGSEDPSKKTTMAPCAGHSLVGIVYWLSMATIFDNRVVCLLIKYATMSISTIYTRLSLKLLPDRLVSPLYIY